MKTYKKLHESKEVANIHIAKIKERGGNVKQSIKEGKILLEYSFDSNTDEEIQTYIDIISMNPDSEQYKKYKDVLKQKYGIDYDKLNKDNIYIENATLSNIKAKKDFLNFDNYIKYAKKIFQLRGLGKIQPNHIEGNVSLLQAKNIGSKINLKIKNREYDGGAGNYAAHDLVDTIIMPSNVDVNTFIHEVGHHFDHYYSKDYKGLAKTITYASSPYSIDKNNEVFAENFLHYFIAPNWLKKNLPDVYNELDKKIPANYKAVINSLIK